MIVTETMKAADGWEFVITSENKLLHIPKHETLKIMCDNEKLLLKFIASLTLCDHMGDVSNDVDDVLKKLGIDIDWDEWSDLRQELYLLGITTLNGTELSGEECD